TREWRVDLTPPPMNLVSGPAQGLLTKARTATFTFNSEGGATVQCRVDGTDADYAACASPYTTASLPDGVHTFFVRAIDPAGNVSTVQTRGWTIDATPPNLAFGAGGPADGSATQAGSASFA